VIFLHEVHQIVGGRLDDFHVAVREQWQPLVERDEGAQLLWFWDHGHGTGPSYEAVSITAVRDWTTWARVVDALTASTEGRAWHRDVAPLRRTVTGKLLLSVPWSPLRDVAFGGGPRDRTDSGGAPALYLHDTGWPFAGRLDDYVEALGRVFHPQTQRSQMIAIEACWRTCPGTGRGDEVVLLQRILDWAAFARLLAGGESASQRGGWMEEGLRYRDRWESKLLRAAPWSPRP
jgi:hypothetical protein